MLLNDLLQRAGLTPPNLAGPTRVTRVTADSRRVGPGSLFVAVRGTTADGHEHAAAALANGAVAVVLEREVSLPAGAPKVLVPNTRRALERLAAAFFGEPAEGLKLVGVTGTNGKTTLVYMIEAVLSAAGLPTGVLGTIDHHLGPTRWPSSLTTPDPVTLHARLREFVERGARAAAFEISSHALDQARADSLALDVAIFTNFTRDHLDYHRTLDAYFAAKESMFTRLLGGRAGGTAVVNADDARVRNVRVAAGVRTWFFGEGARDFGFRIQAEDLTGSTFALETPVGRTILTLPSPGRHNVYNAAAAIAAGVALGVELEVAAGALARFHGAPGRLERVPNARGLNIFVDYAHTDDALRSILESLKRVRDARHAGRKIITVFGCGGDRDRGKRPLMAEAAAVGSNVVIVTSDNPRTEDPAAIVDEVARGIPADWPGELETIVDRREALARALQTAREGDVILVAGKGHEDYQIVGAIKHPFSDRAVLEGLLKD